MRRLRFQFTDLGGTPLGEATNADNRQCTVPLSNMRTGSCSIDSDDPLVDTLLSTDTLCKIYRTPVDRSNEQLLVYGDVIGVTENADDSGSRVDITVADPWWRLGKRLMGTNVDAQNNGIGYNPTDDLSNILAGMVFITDGVQPVGIDGGTLELSGISTELGPWYFTSVADGWSEVLQLAGAPDIELAPHEPTGAGSWTTMQMATLNVWQKQGTTKPKAIFEYGRGKYNIASYANALSKDALLTRAYSLPDGFPDSTILGDQVLTYADGPAIFARGLYEEVIDSDLTVQGLRTFLMAENVAVRKQARQQLSFTPIPDCPIDYGIHYGVGDIVTARAEVLGRSRFDGTCRVYGVQFNEDADDREQINLTLIPGTA